MDGLRHNAPKACHKTSRTILLYSKTPLSDMNSLNHSTQLLRLRLLQLLPVAHPALRALALLLVQKRPLLVGQLCQCAHVSVKVYDWLL